MSPLDDAGLDSAIAEAFGEEVAVVDPIVAEAEPVTAFGEASDEDGTPPQEERPRDEKGRFAAAEDPDVQRFLQRFDGDVDKALRAAVEADSMIGRQGQQMGELQKQLSEIQQAVTQPQEQAVQITQETVDWFDQQIADNPHGAVVWAMQNDPSGALYNRAMDEWFEMSPRQASAFERQIEMAQFAQSVQQQQAPLHQMAEQNQFAAAWNEIKQEIPDLDEHAERILEAAQESPEVVAMLLSPGSPDSKKRVIRNLYKISNFDRANQLVGAAGAAPPGNTQADSFVASGSQHNNPETKSAEDQWKEQVFDPAASGYYSSGWPT